MGKISPVSAKYIIHTSITIDGVVDKPDVIGAVFGQTEGLLGSDLELRELQRSGRIGRIEVNTETKGGKTAGNILVPSSLDKAETAIVAAALEIIQRIGPCNAIIKVERIEDVRISKRQFIVTRAKDLLRNLVDNVIPDSQELTEEVTHSVRVMEIQEYGADKLPAGPAIADSDEVIVVEGRADVIALLKQGFKNAIALNGTSVPQTVIDLSRQKIITAFVDGDRGGDLIIQELLAVAELDYITKAPDGKEVEELQKKEIHKALRSRVVPEQFKAESRNGPRRDDRRGGRDERPRREERPRRDERRDERPRREERPRRDERRDERHAPESAPAQLSPSEKDSFKQMAEDLIGTRGAYLLDKSLSILGKVPVTELGSTLRELSGIYAVIFDGAIDRDLAQAAETSRVSHLVGMESSVRPGESRVSTLTVRDL